MGKPTRQPLSYGFADFEGFHTAFSSASGDLSLSYLSDAIFHLLLPRDPGVEKRFKGGLAAWSLWVLRKLTTIKLRRAESTAVAEDTPSASAYGFRFLTTPAHQDSLTPILEQAPPTQRLLYGHGLEDEEDETPIITSNLAHSLAKLNWRLSCQLLLDSLLTARRIRQIILRMPEHTGRTLPSDFAPRVGELVFRQQLELAVLRQKPCPHQAVFLTYELIPESKAWVQWARESGKRVLHVMHGQWLPIYQVTMATDLLLFSKVDEPWFRQRVDPDVKLWTIGHPRLEMLRRQVGPPAPWNQERLPRIAFFSQPSEGDYSRELRLNDWKILTGLKGRAEIRFRLHPREDREAAARDLKAIGAEFVEVSDAGLKEDLSWCDAVASSWSTVSMEAAACGRGVFWSCTTPEKYEASRELRDAGIGTLIRDVTAWNPYLDAWNHGGWQSPVSIPDHQLQALGMIGDSDRPWLERLGIE